MERAQRGGCARSLHQVLSVAREIRPAGRTAAGSVLWVLLFAIPTAAQTAQRAETAAQDAISRLDLQTAFPRGPEPLNWHFDLPAGALWVVVAIALGILLYALRDMLPGMRTGEAWAQPEGAPGEAASATPAVIVEAADELAARGRYVEAMHVLLLQGLAHLRARLNQQFSDSLTSREILYSTKLPEAARAALRDVVARVELTYFGQRSAGLADYTACRESFNALERSLNRSAPA
jgi:hypothetical protein